MNDVTMKSLYVHALNCILILLLINGATALDNGLARTPPMGWLAWERFKCNTNCKEDPENCISERLFMEMADRLVADGFHDAGYVYVNIDDCWLARRRDSVGRMIADPLRFPRGIHFLSKYMHSKGLKLGIYQDFGKNTCMGFPGIVGHMKQDAQTFAEWQVDMVKLDGCHSLPKDMDEGYTTMGNYLNKTGRPMLFSCSWPYYQLLAKMEPDYKKISKHCNMWRNFDDIQDSWSSIESAIDFYGDNQEVLARHAGPGHWNDPDMLVFGNFHLTPDQGRIQMAVWSMIPAPLLMSNDLRKLDPEFKKILLNRHVIAIDQDPMGIPGKRIYKKDEIEIWKRPITPVFKDQYSYALLFLNRRTEKGATSITFKLKQFGMKNSAGYLVTELFDEKKYGIVDFEQPINIVISPINLVMLKAEAIWTEAN